MSLEQQQERKQQVKDDSAKSAADPVGLDSFTDIVVAAVSTGIILVFYELFIDDKLQKASTLARFVVIMVVSLLVTLVVTVFCKALQHRIQNRRNSQLLD